MTKVSCENIGKLSFINVHINVKKDDGSEERIIKQIINFNKCKHGKSTG